MSAAIERGSKEGQKVIFIFLSIPTSAISQWSFLNLSGLESRGPLCRVPPPRLNGVRLKLQHDVMAPWQYTQQLREKGGFSKKKKRLKTFEEHGFGIEIIIKNKVNYIH